MHHYVSLLIDLLLVLLAAWMVPAGIFFIYAYFAGLKYPVGESVVGRLLVIFFLPHYRVDLAPDHCERLSPIADRLFVVTDQGKSTQ